MLGFYPLGALYTGTPILRLSVLTSKTICERAAFGQLCGTWQAELVWVKFDIGEGVC